MKEPKKCKICGKALCKGNKSGYCTHHVPRSGKDNPMYGVSLKVSEETKEKLRKASTKLWEDKEYREKVVNSNLGKTRTEEFKQGQRERALKQFQDNNQRKIRSEKMKETWQEGKITGSQHYEINRSKAELEIYDALKSHFGIQVSNDSIKFEENGKKRWLYPDGVIFNKTVIEYYGNYWHANPDMYKATDTIEGKYAKDIWEHDKKRLQKLNELGYVVIIIWEKTYLENKEKLVKDLINFFDWDNYKEEKVIYF